MLGCKSTKYRERPLIGKKCDIDTPDSGRVEMEWMVGTYSGLWKEWKGREGGKTVGFTENISKEDIIRESVDSLCRDGADAQYIAVFTRSV